MSEIADEQKANVTKNIGLSAADWIFIPFAELFRNATVKCTMYKLTRKKILQNDTKYTESHIFAQIL